MALNIPVGISNFTEIRSNNYYYVASEAVWWSFKADRESDVCKAAWGGLWWGALLWNFFL